MTSFHHSKPLSSHLGWQKLFPNAQPIDGADIDPDIIMQKYKINKFLVDQKDENSIKPCGINL